MFYIYRVNFSGRSLELCMTFGNSIHCPPDLRKCTNLKCTYVNLADFSNLSQVARIFNALIFQPIGLKFRLRTTTEGSGIRLSFPLFLTYDFLFKVEAIFAKLIFS